ncbi:MAG: hypothetical protein ACTH6N_12850 [Brachybacterium tyrofermentans]
MSSGAPRALLLIGAVGVGKTTTTDAIADELEVRSIPGSAFDLDWLRRSWPAPPGDRFNSRLEQAALRAVSAVHREAGAQVLVAAGVIEERADRASYETAFGCPLTVVRLTAPRVHVRAPRKRRHVADRAGLAGPRDRFDELTDILDAAGVEDAAVPVGPDPRSTAQAVLRAVGI